MALSAPSLLERISGQPATNDPATSRPQFFTDAARELEAARTKAVLVDLSHLGRVLATGKDILDLLHRLSTQDLKTLSPGEGRPTVLTTGKGRIVERLFVHHLGDDGILMVGGPGSAQRVRSHLDRFTFAESTELEDASTSLAQLGLLGPASRDLAAAVGAPVPARFSSMRWDHDNAQVHVLGEDGFSAEGLSFVFAAPAEGRIAKLVSTLLDRGATLAGDQALEAWRVLQGHPLAGRELTEDHNPLEAGLREAVSFTKGCYVGQEVVARLNTYDKVSRLLTGLELPRGASVPAQGTEIRFRDREAGVVCSALLPPGQAAPVALAYLRREAATAGTVVQLGNKAGTEPGTAVVRDLPFTTVP